MSNPIEITFKDPILARLNFRPYRYKGERRVVPFLPAPDEPQTLEVLTEWGEILIVRKGDFLLAEIQTPNDYWPIDPVIFEESYVITRPGYTEKKAVAYLVPLTDITNGDPGIDVTVITLEGRQTVRAGDFYLARGVHGEIWPIMKKKVEITMIPAELADEPDQPKKQSDRSISTDRSANSRPGRKIEKIHTYLKECLKRQFKKKKTRK